MQTVALCHRELGQRAGHRAAGAAHPGGAAPEQPALENSGRCAGLDDVSLRVHRLAAASEVWLFGWTSVEVHTICGVSAIGGEFQLGCNVCGVRFFVIRT